MSIFIFNVPNFSYPSKIQEHLDFAFYFSFMQNLNLFVFVWFRVYLFPFHHPTNMSPEKKEDTEVLPKATPSPLYEALKEGENMKKVPSSENGY